MTDGFKWVQVEYNYELLRRQHEGDELSGRSLLLSQSWQSYGTASSLESNKVSDDPDEGVDFETGLFHSSAELDAELERSIIGAARHVPMAGNAPPLITLIPF